MSIMKIRLELARSEEFPQGSHLHGYEFTAPLDQDYHIDVKEWKAKKEKCHVVRFWGDESHDSGHLVRKSANGWAFHYDIHGDEDDDDAGYRFGDHAFKPGEYVSVKDHDDDELHTFKVITVQPV